MTRIGARDVAAAVAVGVAVALPWLGFLDLGTLSQLGLDPEARRASGSCRGRG